MTPTPRRPASCQVPSDDLPRRPALCQVPSDNPHPQEASTLTIHFSGPILNTAVVKMLPAHSCWDKISQQRQPKGKCSSSKFSPAVPPSGEVKAPEGRSSQAAVRNRGTGLCWFCFSSLYSARSQLRKGLFPWWSLRSFFLSGPH